MRTDFHRGPALPHLEFFSLGGVLATMWNPAVQVAPWIVAAAILALGACWDVFRGAGRVDFILLGLAAYELVIGLTEDLRPGISSATAEPQGPFQESLQES